MNQKRLEDVVTCLEESEEAKLRAWANGEASENAPVTSKVDRCVGELGEISLDI